MDKFQLPEEARVPQSFEVRDGGPPIGVGRSRIYPFSKMLPMQYFEVPAELAKPARSAATQFARKYNWKFLTRAVTENGVSLIRIWRIK